MFIPPNSIRDQLGQDPNSTSSIRLQTSHLLISGKLAKDLFKDCTNVNLVYYPDRQTLMLAPPHNMPFKQLHKANQHLLKDRNLQGDKSIALHEILIDHQIDPSDRELTFELQPGLEILCIKL